MSRSREAVERTAAAMLQERRRNGDSRATFDSVKREVVAAVERSDAKKNNPSQK